MLLPSTREMRSSPRRGNGYSKRLSDGLGFRESPITLFVMAPLLFVMAGSTISSGWMEEGSLATAEEESRQQTCKTILSSAAGDLLHSQDLLRWLSYRSCQQTSGFAGRAAVGEEGFFCSKQKGGGQSVSNSLATE